MKRKGDDMGRFYVDIEIVNDRDLGRAENGDIDPAQVRRKTISGLVDTGAARLVLPEAIVKELGLPVKKSKVKVKYADDRTALRPEVDSVRVYLAGRDGIFTATLEPKRTTALIGAIVLEDLDLLPDCKNQRLIPRDPKYVITELG